MLRAVCRWQVFDFAAKGVPTVFESKIIRTQAACEWIMAASGTVPAPECDMANPTAAMLMTEKGVVKEVSLYGRPLKLPGEGDAGSKAGPGPPTIKLQTWAMRFTEPDYVPEAINMVEGKRKEKKPRPNSQGASPPIIMGGTTSRRRGCHFADVPSPSLLKHLLQGEGGVQQNDSLADG